ncbi:DUF6289 family protein [Massilia sp. AB1]|uniref:DUF6289 family protein n=1 Tax=Massilia sp. AB1 TaxID=2823371 RepID=UPI001B80FC92|nr:DUF6289 family protein [Massilia sp. AB1]MBQ5939175.1 hypothetical protein [Massilia sp. AB1]
MKLKKLYVAVLAITVSAAAYAWPSSTWTRVYYSDSAMTTQVGSQTFTCRGYMITTGQQTAYFDYTEEGCEW